MELLLAHRSIYNLLEIASVKKEDIKVTTNHRRLGKTKALMEFAKDNNYYVLVGNERIAELFKKQFKYKKIKSINSNLDGLGYFVYDECCDTKKIEKLKNSGIGILTGYFREK